MHDCVSKLALELRTCSLNKFVFAENQVLRVFFIFIRTRNNGIILFNPVLSLILGLFNTWLILVA